jgi:hypothetical protein
LRRRGTTPRIQPKEPAMSNDAREVVVVDVKIPFWSMVVLLVKWAIAAIPAFVILFALSVLISAIFGGIFHWTMWQHGVV